MSVDQTSLEEHYRKRHPKSPPPKVQPAATSSPIPADKPESEQVEPSQEDQAKNQTQHSQTSQHRQSRKTFALFVVQPASTIVTYVRNLSAHWQISGYISAYTARCHASSVTESFSMPAAWMNMYRRFTRAASHRNTIAR